MSKSDFIDILNDFIRNFPWKRTIIAFIFGLLVFSDLFVANVLTHIKDTTNGTEINSKGTVIQMATTIVGFNLIDSMIKLKVI